MRKCVILGLLVLWEFTGELSFVVLENGEENDLWYILNRVVVYDAM